MSTARPLETLVARFNSDLQAARDFLGKCQVAPTAPHGFVTETEQVLRSRLRTAAFLLFSGFTLFLSIYFYRDSLPSIELLVCHIGLVIVTGIGAALLSERFGWQLKQLRVSNTSSLDSPPASSLTCKYCR